MAVDIGNRPLRIAIGAGHRNSSGGNEFETGLTALATNEVVKLLRASDGFDVRCYTPQDGLGWFGGPLDAAAAQVRTWAAQGWVADILHELHFEGLGNTVTRGAFVIYPDSKGLVGRNPGNIDEDVKAAAGRMAALIAASFGGATRYGIPGRGMSEKETGVGADGWRLGVFGAWSEPVFNNGSFQFITEGATYTNPTELALMKQPDFPKKHARGIVDAYVYLAQTRGNWTYPFHIGEKPVEPNPNPIAPDGKPYLDGLDDGIMEVAFGKLIAPSPDRDKFVYSFNPSGPISKAWYSRGKSMDGYFPALRTVFVDGQRWYLFFMDGSILYRPNAKAKWAWVNA